VFLNYDIDLMNWVGHKQLNHF